MSISQLIAQTLMTFKADTSQARAEIKALQGAEKDAAKTTLEGIEKRNSAYESLAKGITKANAVLAVANEALRVGGEAFKAYEENQRLSIAAANVSIGELRTSSQGLRTDLDLLKLAAAGNAATFKSNQQQLENAAAAMVAFERAGFDAGKSTEKVREAILKGNIEPLKELGISLDAAKGKQEQFAQLQTVLAEKAREAGSAHAGAGEAFKRAAVEYDNAMREIKIAIGELVVALAPLLSALAKAVGLIADVVSEASRIVRSGSILSGANGMFRRYGGNLLGGESVRATLEADQRRKDGPAWESSFVDPRLAQKMAAFDEWLAAMDARGAALSGSGRKRGGGGESRYRFGGVGPIEVEDRTGIVPRGFGGYGGGDFGGGLAMDPRIAAGNAARANNMADSRDGDILDNLRKFQEGLVVEGRTSILEQILGPASELSTYQQGLQALGETFNSFGGAVASAYGAWITGAESASAAFKKSLAESMKSLATESVVRALSETAWGFGTMWSNPAESATHFKSAALHAAVAVTAGVAAKGAYSAGWGGGGASAGGSGAPSVIGSGGGGGRAVTDNRPIIVNVGDVFADESPGAKSGRVARAVRMATRGTSNVSWDN